MDGRRFFDVFPADVAKLTCIKGSGNGRHHLVRQNAPEEGESVHILPNLDLDNITRRDGKRGKLDADGCM